MKASFKVTPEAEKFVLGVARSSTRWPQIADRCVKRVAESCATQVKKKIEDQAFPNVRLSDAWLRRKAKAGLDLTTLRATRRYYGSIRAKRVEPGIWGVVCNDLVLRDRLENGNRRGSPPRPHWGPVLTEFQINFARIFANEVVAEMFGVGGKTS